MGEPGASVPPEANNNPNEGQNLPEDQVPDSSLVQSPDDDFLSEPELRNTSVPDEIYFSDASYAKIMQEKRKIRGKRVIK